MDPVIIVEGRALDRFLELVKNYSYGIHKLSVHVDGKQVKFKINEEMWSEPMGRKREDY